MNVVEAPVGELPRVIAQEQVDQPKEAPHKLRIGLALSGGGFRATLFHLGVVRRLADLGLLNCVKHICSVSGGSILAGHLACKWGGYSHQNSFKEAADELIGFTERGIRQKIMFYWPSLWLLSFVSKYNPTWKLKGHYDELYAKKILSSLSSDPAFHFLSTSLTNPRHVFCFGKNGCEHHRAKGNRYGPNSFRIAGAVTASSAFPGLFPPLTISRGDVGATLEQMNAEFVSLSDGGVFDNLGVYSLRDIDESENLDFLIISDASAVLDAAYGSAFAREWKYLPRLFDISGQRIYDLDLASRRPKEILFSIHAPGDNHLNSEVRSNLGKVRTDLDAFSNTVIRALICHGQGVAQTELTAYCTKPPDRIQGERLNQLRELVNNLAPLPIWEPYEGTPPGHGDLEKEINEIKEESERKVYRIRFGCGLLPYVLLLGLAAWFVLYCFWPSGYEAKSYTEGQLSDVINSLWDKNLLPEFAKEYEHRTIAINGIAYDVPAGKVILQSEQQNGVNIRVISIDFEQKGWFHPKITKGDSVTGEGWVEKIEYPSTPFGAVNMKISKAVVTVAPAK